mmetsp:Transcript_45980/g.96529  ORF Transcript_45980/g.96529 Transcript_45980/m.96529 type:complete len:122 (+) Transcript_45980:435-800(+)
MAAKTAGWRSFFYIKPLASTGEIAEECYDDYDWIDSLERINQTDIILHHSLLCSESVFELIKWCSAHSFVSTVFDGIFSMIWITQLLLRILMTNLRIAWKKKKRRSMNSKLNCTMSLPPYI